MNDIKIFSDDREVILSTTIVSHMGSTIKIYPFESDKDYCVNVNIIPLTSNKPTETRTSIISPSEMTVYFEAFFTPYGFGSTGPNFNFASDATHNYFFDCAVAFAGNIELYTKIVVITVTRRAK